MKIVVVIGTVLLLAVGIVFWLQHSRKKTYQSPIDGQSYRANWRIYNPTNGTAAKAVGGRVQNQGVRLLSTQAEFERSIEVSELADFMRQTGQAIDSALGLTNEVFELVVQTQVTKEKRPVFEMASKGNVSEDVLQRISDALEGLLDYRSRKDDLKYEIRFAIGKTP